MALNPGTRIGPYEIENLLGSGGMGEVYRAEDPRLGRKVAIKLLREEFASDPDRLRRFELEARSASALNHPNIITIYEIGDFGATRYIAMEFVEGQTLRHLLREGSISTKRMLQLSVQIAEGLAKAHAAGIVHRDLKPENLMITEDGFIKILDFGLAKLVAQSGEGGEEAATLTKVTRQGAVVGTIAYMSPEQACGDPVDHRSDQFSLGLILYEMATGRHPFNRNTASQILAAVIADNPEPITSRCPAVPAAFAMLVQRCLAKDPGARYESTRDLAQDLKAAMENTAPPVEQAARIESLAVLPLVDTSGDPGQEYFANGMTEALITALAKIGGLRVISRTSVMRYKHTDKSLPQIGRELNVQAIVEGSVLRAGNQVRITAQLIDAAADKHLWAESYQGDLQDILSLQNQVARSIAGEIQIKLTPQEQTLLERSKKMSADAQEAYLKGMFYFSKWSMDGMNNAVECFKAALKSEPEFASAHAALADANLQLAFWGWDSLKDVAPRAREAALKALELDPDLTEAHLALANVHCYADWDLPRAEKEYKRAIELNPNHAEAHARWATLALGLGRYDVARQELEQVLKLDPQSPQYNLIVGISLLWQGRYEESIEQCRKVLQMDPDYQQAHFFLAMNYRQAGLDGESIVEWKKLFAIEAKSAAGFMDRAFRRSGLKGGLVAAARFLKWGYFIWRFLRYVPLIKGRYVAPVLIAILYVAAREKEQTFLWLERAYRERDTQMLTLKAAIWDPVRSDPRFESLMRRIGLPL